MYVLYMYTCACMHAPVSSLATVCVCFFSLHARCFLCNVRVMATSRERNFGESGARARIALRLRALMLLTQTVARAPRADRIDVLWYSICILCIYKYIGLYDMYLKETCTAETRLCTHRSLSICETQTHWTGRQAGSHGRRC